MVATEPSSTPRGPGRPRGGGWTPDEGRRRLAEAAERCLVRSGLEKMTMAEVATEAGVSPATVYRYYAGREELLSVVLASAAERVTRNAAEAVADATTLEHFLVEGVVEIMGLVTEDPLIRMVLTDTERLLAGSVVSGPGAVFDTAVDFAHGVLATRPDLAAELRQGLPLADAVDHLMRVGLALLLTDSPMVRRPNELRRYLRTMVLPALLEIRPPLPTPTKGPQE